MKNISLGFEVDKLTRSIENAISGEVFETSVLQLKRGDERDIKKQTWVFDWKKETQHPQREVYKLTTVNNPTVIHGLISFSDEGDHIFMHLIESAGFNKGKRKLYKGVAGNLVAFACKISFEKGYDGVVSFVSKTKLIEHYKATLGAKQFAGNRLFIDTPESQKLVRQYFNTENNAEL